MTSQTKTTTNRILMFMHIIAWIAFIGFMIEAGAILVSYVVSLYNPEASKNLYLDLNLSELRQLNIWEYTGSVSFLVALSCLKAYIAFLVIKASSKINMTNPFKIEVAQILDKIADVLLLITIIVIISNGHTRWLLKKEGIVQEKLDIQLYIFMAMLVFVIAKIFKRGVEIQSEHELTV
jgi:hypothetical protein